MSAAIDCAAVLTALARGERLDAAGEVHRASCAECAVLADGLAAVGRAVATWPPAEPPSDLDERVLLAAAPLLAENARAAAVVRTRSLGAFDGGRLAHALVPAILLFPLLVVADAWLLRFVHETLAAFLPRALSTWFVLSYAALLAAFGCLVFGAIPLLVERQAPLLVWKEDHVRS